MSIIAFDSRSSFTY